MFLQKYNFVVNYVPGKDLICSDTLTRAQLKQQTPEMPKTEINFQAHSVMSTFSISSEKQKY